MRKPHPITAIPALLAAALLPSCGGDPNSPGIEYMPDMYRSPSLEAYVDPGQDPFYVGEDKAQAQRATQSARLPVAGTVPFSMDPSKAAFNFPYLYPGTPDGYEQAGLELKCPLPMTQAVVDQGKVVYDKFCQQCHGAKGEGDGSVVKNGDYPQPPSYTAALKDLPEGKIFHSLVYGKNVAMGSHAGQLNKEERWQVTRYVQFLQNGGKLTRDTPPPAADSTATAAK
ncbi:MAG: cytochrome c [Flavobacteriales bacterium]|nr:cytochrome c [Flavobacteriales bacterium]MBK8948054.1 cytochrome c [Flavobacteriales bacterium]MBK9699906.1 cytochrome c [Flavobacteriales bacterium]